MSTAVPSYEPTASPRESVAGEQAAGERHGQRETAPSPAASSPAPKAAPAAKLREASAGAPASESVLRWTPSWAPLLLKWRWTLVVLWALVHLLAFNGQWRIGPDSAIFRSVAHSLAIGDGYVILGQPQRQVYPGLPLLLAGLEKLLGAAAWPGVVVMLAISAAILWLTYHLIRRIAPAWAATVVTAGVGFNATFMTHGHQLLTDLPFLLGVMMALWGWETLTDPGMGRRLRSAAWLAAGLGLAATMRPTFWVLALAFLLVSVGGLLVGLFPKWAPRAWTSGLDRARSWRFYAVCLLLVVLTGLLFAIFDPRTRTLDLLAGGYEAEMADRVLGLGERVREMPGKLWEMLEDHLEALFFAERVEGLNLVLVLTLLAGVLLVSRRRPLWGLLVAILLVTLFLASTAARYYLMVLPILWLAWVMIVCALAQRSLRTTAARSLFAGVLIGVVWLCNLGHDVKLILEQRSRPFVEHYKDGQYARAAKMAALIAQVTAPGERIIGPYAPEMTYLSGRRVLGRRELFSGRESTTRAWADAVLESGATWAVFPASAYAKRDAVLYRLGRQGVFVPSNADNSTVYAAGELDDKQWYLTRDWAIDETMIPEE